MQHFESVGLLFLPWRELEGLFLYDSFVCVMFFLAPGLFPGLRRFTLVGKYYKDCTQPKEKHGQSRLMRLQILGGGFHLNNCVLVFRMRAGTKRSAP